MVDAGIALLIVAGFFVLPILAEAVCEWRDQ